MKTSIKWINKDLFLWLLHVVYFTIYYIYVVSYDYYDTYSNYIEI